MMATPWILRLCMEGTHIASAHFSLARDSDGAVGARCLGADMAAPTDAWRRLVNRSHGGWPWRPGVASALLAEVEPLTSEGSSGLDEGL